MSTSVKFVPQARKYIANVKEGTKTKDDLLTLYNKLKHNGENTEDKKDAMSAIRAHLQTMGISIVAPSRSRKVRKQKSKSRKNRK